MRKRFEVYVVRDSRGKVAYVGQGFLGRGSQHCQPNKYKLLGLKSRPVVKITRRFLTRKKAIEYEAVLIDRLRPYVNKAKFNNAGGCAPWNKGKRKKDDDRLKGGRPVGIPMSEETKKRLSKSLKGKARRWMVGRSPWNKGLTKEVNQSLAKMSESMLGNISGHRRVS